MKINHIYHGNALPLLRQIPDNFIDCCVSSPPYYGLRDYQTAQWIGGDENCKHKVGRFTTKHSEKQGSNLGSGDVQAKEICPHCGAIRQDEQIGLEETPEIYIEKLVKIFEEVRRTLKPTGTLWLNIGDSYAGGGGGNYNKTGISQAGGQHITNVRNKNGWLETAGLKSKDLIGIPWMLAFALRKAGWYLRMDIIWHKPNPMPESIQDRPTKSHEYIFLFAKNTEIFRWIHRDTKQLTETHPEPDYRWFDNILGKELKTEPYNWKEELIPGKDEKRYDRINLWEGRSYYYDYQAILEPANYDGRTDTFFKGSQKYLNGFAPAGTSEQSFAKKGHERWSNKIVGRTEKKMEGTGYGGDGKGLHGHSGYFDGDGNPRFNIKDGIPARNKRSVWTVTTKPYSEAHFATFPENLIVDCIKAGCPEQVCNKCGKPREKIITKSDWTKHQSKKMKEQDVPGNPMDRGGHHNDGLPYIASKKENIGLTDCGCRAPCEPGIVLDPFMGAGTTAIVARKLNRNYLGIELNNKYIKIAKSRMSKELGMFA